MAVVLEPQPPANPPPKPDGRPKRKRRVTEAQFVLIPKDRGKVELVDGEVVDVPTTLRHEDIGMNLCALWTEARVRQHGRIFGASAGYRMANGNIRSPDLSFMRTERLPGGEAPDTFGDGAPDLAVEVVSPSERPQTLFGKLADYFESGAQQVWLIRPETASVAVYASPMDVRVLSGDDSLSAGDLIPGFTCRVADLFAAA